MLKWYVSIAFTLATVVGAAAGSIDHKTKCSVVAATMDADSPDRGKIAEIVEYIKSVYQTADRSYGVQGKAQIIPRLSADGMRTSIALTTVKCRDHAEKTIQDVALENYDTLRGMQKALGYAD